MDEMETTEKSSGELEVTIISNDQVSEVSKSSRLLPTATVFIKEELFRDFDNVNETSQDDDVTEMHDSYITIGSDKSKSDEEDDDDDEDDDNDCDGDDDNAIYDDDEEEDQNDEDDEADEEEIDESDLKISAWPVAVKLQTVGSNVITIDDTDASDENDSSSSRSPSIKRKKLSRTRKKRSSATPFTCRLCNTKFDSEILLTVHLHTSHRGNINVCGANNKFTCLLCKAVLGSKSLLHAHMTRVHTEKKVINCTKCNKGFKYRSYLTVNSYNKRSKPHCDKEYYRNFTCFHCSVNKS